MTGREAKRFARQFFAFIGVGAVGFLCDAGFFTLFFSGLGMPIVLARLLAFLPATVATWLLNRNIAFRGQGVKLGKNKEYVKYLTVQGVGMAVSFVTFYMILKLFPGLEQFPLIPLALGSGVALTFNFLGVKLLVFTK